MTHTLHDAKQWLEEYERFEQQQSFDSARRLVLSAIQGHLPWYDTTAAGTVNLGAAGWRQWLSEQQEKEVMTIAQNDDPMPLPWE